MCINEFKKGYQPMANYPQGLAQDAAYQSHTSRLTELWSLPRPAQGLNTYNNNKDPRNNIVKDEKGDLFTGFHIMFARWRNHFSQL